VNKELYGQIIKLPEELVEYLQKCFEQVPNSDSTVEGHKRNIFLRDKGQVTFQQLERIQNWFKYFDGKKEDAPYVLNRESKSHKGYNDDIKITENLKRINDIMKKII